MNHERIVENLLSVFYSATAAQKVEGAGWYNTAGSAIWEIAERTGVSETTVAAVVARLSPQNVWKNNLRDAEVMCAAFTSGLSLEEFSVATYPVNKEKAWAILTGELTIEQALSGFKIYNFYLNLCGRMDVVTVDGHAFNAAVFGIAHREAITKAPSLSETRYFAVAEAYADAAKRVGWTRRDFQAVVWVTYKAFKLPRGTRLERLKRAA